ncbi:hypothetical protein HHI36_012937 [Cryptolaemus montrouzieri]|uniref:Uncharacterized protein n=1 Tax=Cryptolaemus montrouzieri TaxID=559131 RepID=A0ABD2NGR0_9CUCU
MHNNIRSASKNIDEFRLFIDGLIYNEGCLNSNDGTLIYVRNEISFNHDIVNLGPVKAVQLHLKLGNSTVDVLAAYRSPSLCPLEFTIALENYFEAMFHL